MNAKPLLLLGAGLLLLSPLHADPLHEAIAVSKANNRAEAQSQQRIDHLDDQTHAMLAEYQRLNRELDQLSSYDAQLQRIVASQQQEMASIEQQMQQLELTRREVMPLLLRMLDWLDALLAEDRPFLADERSQRVQQLRALMDRADVSIGEKYRRVLEAYQVEMAYGRNIEAYRGELVGDTGTRTVDFLRIGRIGLYYQTLDRREVGHWDASTRSWRPLPDSYVLAIRDGLRIAHNRAAPQMLRLPVMAPTDLDGGES